MASAAGSTDAATVGRAYFDAVAARDLDAMTALLGAGGVDELHGLASLRVPGIPRVVREHVPGLSPTSRWRSST